MTVPGSVQESAAMKRLLIVGVTALPGKEDFADTCQDVILTSLRKILNIFSWDLRAFAAISLLVKGIGSIDIMLVPVAERTREIGLRQPDMLDRIGALRYESPLPANHGRW